ncbi:MAG TPA: septal ring lytic transglycosylase RlpA family protein, partial [Chroococcidiopsis sp.]
KGFQVQVNGATVATVARRDQADAIADQMRGVLRDPQFDPTTLRTGIVDGKPAGLAGDRLLFVVSSSVSRRQGQNAEILAIEWINNLRAAFDQEPVTLSAAQYQMWALSKTGKTLEGTASWYGPRFHGRLTANGEIFDQNTLTAAHPSLPFNTYLEVTNLKTGRSVVVRINDRGPYIGQRSLDLSRAAARCLDSESSGVIRYRASILQQAPNKGNVEVAPEPLLAEQDGRLARRN